MKAYLTTYYEYFGIQECDPVWDEYEYIVNGKMVIAQNVHHILFGKGKKDNRIENLMGLNYNNHTAAHNEQLNRYELLEIHKEFLTNNPY